MEISTYQPGVEIQELHSHILQQDLQLYIKLPWSYEHSDQTYPVLFSLDANRVFPIISSTSLVFETPGMKAQEILIVGVGYKLDPDRMMGLAQWAAWRTRDFTPVRSLETEQGWQERLAGLLGGKQMSVQSGGAASFLKALQEEVIPFVEATYRVSAKDRGLAGYSYGGLFALYALFNDPETFSRYFAGSPSMWAEVFDYEASFAGTHNDLKAKLFLSHGEQETELHEPLNRLLDQLRSRNYPGLEVLSHVLAGEGHLSAYPAAISRALRVLYYEGLVDG